MAGLKEDPAADQKDMAPEDWDKPKLVPLLTEAWQLVVNIEGKKTEALKKVRALEKAKRKLETKHAQLE